MTAHAGGQKKSDEKERKLRGLFGSVLRFQLLDRHLLGHITQSFGSNVYFGYLSQLYHEIINSFSTNYVFLSLCSV